MKRSVTWRLTALMLCALCWDISAKETVDCSVEMTLQAGPSPSLDLLDLDYATYPYPRTLPVKASLTDLDELKINCPQCDGGTLVQGIADDAHPSDAPRSGYRWTLKGPGSLNQAYDMRTLREAERALDALRDERDNLREEIAELDETIKQSAEVLETLEEKFRTQRQERDRLADEIRQVGVRSERLARAIEVAERWTLGPISTRNVRRMESGRLAETTPSTQGAPAQQKLSRTELIAKRSGLDEQIARLEHRVFELSAYSGRFSHTVRLPLLLARVASAEAARRARHTVTCDWATKAVPLLLSLGRTHSDSAELNNALRSIRQFLEICAPENPPSFEVHRDGILTLKETCQTLALGVPSPSPIELELAKTCGALYHELSALDVEREVRARIDRQQRRPMLEDPRREIRALRGRLTELRNERIDTSVELLQRQHDREMMRLEQRRRSGEIQLSRDKAIAASDRAEGMAAEGALRIDMLRAERDALNDAQETLRRQWFRAERLARKTQQAVRTHYERGQSNRVERTDTQRRLAEVDERIVTQREAVAQALRALTASKAAVGQVVWYSPPPLQQLLAEDDVSARELETAREQRRRAVLKARKLESTLTGLWSKQLEHLEAIFNHVGRYRILSATESMLTDKKAQLLEAIARRSETLASAAELRRTRLNELRSELEALDLQTSLSELVAKRTELEQRQREATSEVVSKTQAVSKPFELYAARLRAVAVEERRLEDTYAEIVSTLATFANHRTLATEHEASGVADHEVKALYTALGADSTGVVKSPLDADHVGALLKQLEEHAAGVRREEQEGEEAAALVARHKRMLTDTEARIAQASKELKEARDTYRGAVDARVEAIAQLDDVDAQLALVKQQIRQRWQTARHLAHRIYDLLRGNHSAIEGPVSAELQTSVRGSLAKSTEAVERFLSRVMAESAPYESDGELTTVDVLKEINPLVETARDALADLAGHAMSRPSSEKHLSGTHTQQLHHALEEVEIELAEVRHTKARTLEDLNTQLGVAKKLRAMATDGSRDRAMAEVSNARAAYARAEADITKRLVSRLRTSIELLATDRGRAAGRADDEAVGGTAKLQYDSALKARVELTPIPATGGVSVRDTRGACRAAVTKSPARPAKWSEQGRLPKAISAGESLVVTATPHDEDALKVACEGMKASCKGGAKKQTMTVSSYHPVTWTSDNAAGYAGDSGRFEGGATTPGSIFVAPGPDGLKEGDVPVCTKPIVVTANAANGQDDLAADRALSALSQTVLVRAGKIEPEEAVIEGVAGQPITLTFDVSTRREDGTPLSSNIGFDEPLDGQLVKLKVMRIDDTTPEAQGGDWGFDGAQREIESRSRAGIISETLTLSPTPGRYRVEAFWRQGESCQTSLEIITPVNVAARVLYAPESQAFYDNLMPLVLNGKASSSDLAKLITALDEDEGAPLPPASRLAGPQEGEADPKSGAKADSVQVAQEAGAWFRQKLQVWAMTSNALDQSIGGATVTLSAKAGTQLETMGTQQGGVRRGATLAATSQGQLGFTRAAVLPRPGLTAEVKATAALPGIAVRSANASYGQSGLTKARVGSYDSDGGTRDQFTVSLRGPTEAGRIYHGEGALSGALFEGASGGEIVTLEGAQLNGVILSREGTMLAGVARYEKRYPHDTAGGGCVRTGGLELCIESLTLRAGEDALLSGKVRLVYQGQSQAPQTLGPFDVWGTWRPGDGMWLEFIDAFTGLKLSSNGEAALEVGATAILDLSHGSSPPGLAASWMGVSIHRPRVALSPLRAVDQGRERVVISPDRIGWSWPLSDMQTFGEVERPNTLNVMPGLTHAQIERLHARVEKGELVIDDTTLSLPLPGGDRPLIGRVHHGYGVWELGLGSSPTVRLGDVVSIRLAPDAHGVLSAAGIERLVGTARVEVEGLSPLIMAGFDHAPERRELSVTSSSPPTLVRLNGLFPATVHGLTLTHRQDPVEHPLGRTASEVNLKVALPSGAPAEGRLSVSGDHQGVDSELVLDAAVYAGGSVLKGTLKTTHVGLEGRLESDGRGLNRISKADYHGRITAEYDPTTSAHFLSMSAWAPIEPGDNGAPNRVLSAPLWTDHGHLWLGVNHSHSDGYILGEPVLRLAAPERSGGKLMLTGLKGRDLIDGRVRLDYTHGLETEAILRGRFGLLGPRGDSSGIGKLRITRKGTVDGELAMRWGIDGAVGNILSAASRATVHGSGEVLTIATERFEGFAAYASALAEGRLRADLNLSSGKAKVTTPLKLWTRGKVSVEAGGATPLGLEFNALVRHDWTFDEGSKWGLLSESMDWSGYVSGAINLGFLTPALGSYFTSGSGTSCDTPMCFSPKLDEVVDHLGISLKLGPELVASGRCIRACAP